MTATTLMVLALVAAAALGNDHSSSVATRCTSNMRHLAIAWELYNESNDGRLVENYHGGLAQGGAAAADPNKSPWATGWEDWTLSHDNTNTSFIRDAHWARLAPYINTPEDVHRCPEDHFVSHGQQQRGWQARARTVSMNGTLGEGNAEAGPWDQLYAHRKTISQLTNPGPGDTTVFLDEHPDSVNDPFFFPPHNQQWIDLPASLHNGGAMFSFADEHVELHSWITNLRVSRVTTVGLTSPSPWPNDPDIHWMSFHSQRSSTNSY